MEALSPTMEEGRLVEWKKQEGDTVAVGDVLAEVETDKAVMELVARAAGTLLKHVVEAGATVPVSELVAVIGEPGEDVAGKRGRVEAGRRSGTAGQRDRRTAGQRGSGAARTLRQHSPHPVRTGRSPCRQLRLPRPSRREQRPSSQAARAGGQRGQGSSLAGSRPRHWPAVSPRSAAWTW